MPLHARRVLSRGILIATAVAACLALPFPADAAPSTGVVVGTVRSADTGTPPVAGVAVTAADPATGRVVARATTAANGTYRLDPVPPGTWSVCFDGSRLTTAARPAGYYSRCAATAPTSAVPVTVHSGEMVRGVDPLIGYATVITGVVTDPAGNPVRGVGVQAHEGLPDGLTGADGRYRIVVPWRDLGYPLSFHGLAGRSPLSSVGFVDLDYTDPEGHVILSPPPGAVIEVDTALRPAASATGRITDLTGHPLAGALVSIEGNESPTSVTTGADGSYRVDGLDPALRHFLSVDARTVTGGSSRTGYLSRCYRNTPVYLYEDRVVCRGDVNHPTDTLPLVAGGVAGTDFALRPAGAISGTLVDADGHALAGITVDFSRLTSPNKQFWMVPAPVTSDSAGHWRVDGVEADAWTVCATGVQTSATANPDPDGYQRTCAATTTTVTPGSTAATAPLVVTDRGGIDVTVLGPDGAPVEDARLSYLDASWHGVGGNWPTDGTGHFRFGQVPEGTGYSVCAFDPPASGRGYAACAGDVTVGRGTTTVTLTLAPLGSLSGRVTRATSPPTPVDDVWIVATGLTGRGTWTTHTGADGRYTLGSLPAGDYKVCAVTSSDPIRCYGDVTQTQPPVPVHVASSADTPGVDVHFPRRPR